MPLRPSPLAQALRAFLFGAGLSVAAVPALADAPAARSYHIAPMSLESALNQFGRESGVLISFGSQVTSGVQSPGLTASTARNRHWISCSRAAACRPVPKVKTPSACNRQPLPTRL